MDDRFTTFQIKKQWDAIYNKPKKPSYKNTLGLWRAVIVFALVLAVVGGIAWSADYLAYRGVEDFYIRYDGSYYKGSLKHGKSELPEGYALADDYELDEATFWDDSDGSTAVSGYDISGSVYTCDGKTAIYISRTRADNGEVEYHKCKPTRAS
jgi:hypothetical protein